ncbi:hypothetical protein FACS189473_5240 [Spirochaetia bacterium]|nr:hypothetical protein FACS189473_5240 [Spirochaetia bacterium]
MKEDEKEVKKTVRITSLVNESLKARAKLNRCKDSDIIRIAINEYLLKEINDNNLIMEHLPKIMRELKHDREAFNTFTDFFIHWTSFFFFYSGDSNLSDQEFNKRMAAANSKRDRMIEGFKEYKRANKKSFAEQLVMEFFEFGSNEGTIK